MTRYVVCDVEELPRGSKRTFQIGVHRIGVFNVNGSFHALRNLCPHAGAPVCEGVVSGTTEGDSPYDMRWTKEGEILRCPWHGWEFDIASGKTITEPIRKVQSYPVNVEDGQIAVELPDSRGVHNAES